jgi:hypothetical protein
VGVGVGALAVVLGVAGVVPTARIPAFIINTLTTATLIPMSGRDRCHGQKFSSQSFSWPKTPLNEITTAPKAPNHGTPRGTGPKLAGINVNQPGLKKKSRPITRIIERYTSAMIKTVRRVMALDYSPPLDM